LSFCPPKVRKVITEFSIYDLSQLRMDLQPFLDVLTLFFFQLDDDQIEILLNRLPPSYHRSLMRKGLLHLFPDKLKRVLVGEDGMKSLSSEAKYSAHETKCEEKKEGTLILPPAPGPLVSAYIENAGNVTNPITQSLADRLHLLESRPRRKLPKSQKAGQPGSLFGDLARERVHQLIKSSVGRWIRSRIPASFYVVAASAAIAGSLQLLLSARTRKWGKRGTDLLAEVSLFVSATAALSGVVIAFRERDKLAHSRGYTWVKRQRISLATVSLLIFIAWIAWLLKSRNIKTLSWSVLSAVPALPWPILSKTK